MENFTRAIITVIGLSLIIDFAGLESSRAAPKSSATPVTDVENPARQPFAESANALFQAGSRDAIFSLSPPPEKN